MSSSSTRALAPQASTAYERRALVTSSRSEPRGAAHARKHAYEYAHAHMHMHTCTCTHAHMHMHTCTCTLAWARVAPGGRPNFVGLIAFFWAQIARNFHLSDYCENKNETRKCLAIYLPVSTSSPLGQPLRLYSRGFLRGACLEGLAEPIPKELDKIDWCLFSEPGSAI